MLDRSAIKYSHAKIDSKTGPPNGKLDSLDTVVEVLPPQPPILTTYWSATTLLLLETTLSS